MQGMPQGGGDEEEGAIFAEINVTPLTDVFIVLLIIFMVVASSMVEAERDAAQAKALLSEKAMRVQTPEGAGDTPLVPKDVIISILPDETIFIENDQVALADLPAKLQQVKQGSVSTRVVIRGDADANYKVIMQVIASARRVGLSDVALAARPRD